MPYLFKSKMYPLLPPTLNMAGGSPSSWILVQGGRGQAAAMALPPPPRCSSFSSGPTVASCMEHIVAPSQAQSSNNYYDGSSSSQALEPGPELPPSPLLRDTLEQPHTLCPRLEPFQSQRVSSNGREGQRLKVAGVRLYRRTSGKGEKCGGTRDGTGYLTPTCHSPATTVFLAAAVAGINSRSPSKNEIVYMENYKLQPLI